MRIADRLRIDILRARVFPPMRPSLTRCSKHEFEASRVGTPELLQIGLTEQTALTFGSKAVRELRLFSLFLVMSYPHGWRVCKRFGRSGMTVVRLLDAAPA